MALVALLTAGVAEWVLYRSLGELNFVTASATFLGVYVREAHPAGGCQIGPPQDPKFSISQPTSGMPPTRPR